MPTPLEAARSLREALDANAAQTAGGPLSPETIDALRSAELFGVMCPEEVGGAGLSMVDAIDVFAETAWADGSTGWCHMASASAIAYFACYCEDAFVEKLFASGTPLAAGQFAPNGRATREAGGYRLTGRYQFGSGIDYAQWAGAGFLVLPPEGSDAPAEYRFGLVPKSDVTLLGNWDVLGLTSTASLDYRIDEVWVPDEATFLFAAPTRRRGRAAFDLGVIANTAAGHAGFAIGVVRRALDELRRIALSKARMGASSFMRESEAFLLDLGELDSRRRANEAWVSDAFAEVERRAEQGVVDVPAINRARQATVHVTQDGADIARRAYLRAGTSALRTGALERCFRDIHAGTQHFFASPASTLDMARDLMAESERAKR